MATVDPYNVKDDRLELTIERHRKIICLLEKAGANTVGDLPGFEGIPEPKKDAEGRVYIDGPHEFWCECLKCWEMWQAIMQDRPLSLQQLEWFGRTYLDLSENEESLEEKTIGGIN